MTDPKSRIYWRNGRAWADFRDYADVGGKREPLRADGERLATKDPDIATALLARRLEELEQRRRGRTFLGIDRQATFGAFVVQHLEQKAKAGVVEDKQLALSQRHLDAAIEFFGQGRDLASISVRDVRDYLAYLSKRKGSSGRPLASNTLRNYLFSLSNLFRRAASEGYIPPGQNPVAALMDKPRQTRDEASWLEAHDATLFLEAARLYQPVREDLATPGLYPLIATFLLTGGRRAEVTGLLVEDVSFDRKTVTFRPNEYRRLKSKTSRRVVPLWPQLEGILREYVFGGSGPRGRLLFPRNEKGPEQPVGDLRKAFDAVAKLAGLGDTKVRPHMLRHTYTAARLQTLDNGAPVAIWTVARELGHSSTELVERIYGHLGTVRHRSEVVEYQIQHHEKQLGDRLRSLRALAVTGK